MSSRRDGSVSGESQSSFERARERGGLTNSQMSINTRISSSASKILIFFVRNMQMGLWIPVSFGQSEIYHVDLASSVN